MSCTHPHSKLKPTSLLQGSHSWYLHVLYSSPLQVEAHLYISGQSQLILTCPVLIPTSSCSPALYFRAVTAGTYMSCSHPHSKLKPTSILQGGQSWYLHVLYSSPLKVEAHLYTSGWSQLVLTCPVLIPTPS